MKTHPIHRRLAALAAVVLAFSNPSASLLAETFSEEYEKHRKASQKPQPAATEAFLLEAEKAHSGDPQYWVARGNFYFSQSPVVAVTREKPGAGDFEIRDADTGKTVGSLTGGRRDPEKVNKAIAALEEGVKRFPQRFDIRFGICYIQQESGAFDQQLAGMKAACAYAKKNPQKLKWLGGKPYSMEGVRDTMHGYFMNQYKLETEQGDRRMLAAAKLYAIEFPDDARAHNDLALCAGITKDYKAVVMHLKNAHEADPQDGIVLINLAATLADYLEKPDEAKIYYKKILALKDPGKLKARAEEALAKLFAVAAPASAEKVRVVYSRYFNAEGEPRYQPDGSYRKVLEALGESFDVRVDKNRPSAENLAGVDVIVISNPSEKAVGDNPPPNQFDAETIATLVRFVRGGGGLIVMGNQENHNLETGATNRLLKEFGMQFVAEHTDIKSIDLPAETPVLGGLRWGYYTGNRVALDAAHPAKPHALISNDTSVKPLKGERNAEGCLLGMAKLGRGHVLAITDAGWISNSVLGGKGIAGVTIDGHHNLEIFKRLLFWIGQVEPSRKGDAFAKGAKAVKLSDTGAGEGPAWHPQLGLLTSGHGGIVRHSLKDGKSELFVPDAGTNGLLFDREGKLLACEPKRKRVTRRTIDGKGAEVLTDSFEGKPYASPNDITYDANGRIYFSDPRYGSREEIGQVDAAGQPIEGVYRIDPDGKVSRIITHEVDRPNGVLVSRDQRFLYVADNNNNTIGGARKLWRFDLRADGTVEPDSQSLVFDWGSARGPDGLVEDARGYLYVAAGRNQPKAPNETKSFYGGGIYVFNPDDEFIDFAAIPNDEVTNCTFGGDESKTLFITAGGTLWSIETPVGAAK